MKRSDMEKAIFKQLMGASMREDWANQILEVVEACGMLPPVPAGYGSGVVLEDLNWEPEDTNESK